MSLANLLKAPFRRNSKPAPTTMSSDPNGPEPALAVAEQMTAPDDEQSLIAKLGNKLVPEQLKRRINLHAALERAVDNSAKPQVDDAALSQDHGWLNDLFDDDILEELFKREHMGNYVKIRNTEEQIFESMPLYARIGMHLLFYGRYEIRFLHNNRVRKLLVDQSIKQGKIYDSTDPEIVGPHIESFIKTYNVDLNMLANPDIKSYKTINEFFARRLKPGLRPISAPDDNSVITSAADCRLMVFSDVTAAKKIWVKGKNFTIPNLLGSKDIADQFGPAPALAIFRLAPQDYHRYHSPVSGIFGGISHTGTDLFTVNPQAVNEDLDVFTGNKRDVVVIRSTIGGVNVPVAFVAVGALLVGAIGWEKQQGDMVKKGEGLGWFQYGGSTCICVFPTGTVAWDEDLLKTSQTGIETLVNIGEKIGTLQAP
ncbi:hypothetical protein EXIGLDRAFT_650196 [Exidia glandulosa HHB12029]|uniref:Phosphatidylserine decarboxylase n=1 Tax=Exidia glandulosa HHB12029 TaxID=1314781 RepID=A0A165FSU8_EXIGL|nr:hypothetical protein EXIGLDRAFT_650196 [Exidia glandulosa HHB12029]